MQFLITAFLATLIASLLIFMSKSWHGRFSMDGMHGVHKMHIAPTPRVGGVAIMLGLLVAYSQAPTHVQLLLGPMLLASILAFGAGLVEDLTKRVGVLPRLIATMVSGLAAMYLTGITVQDIGLPPLDWLLSFVPAAVIFTAFAVGGIANSVNITDGFIGLAAGAVAVMVGAMGFIALAVGDSALSAVCFLVVAVALGFGAINWPYGKLFMGDAQRELAEKLGISVGGLNNCLKALMEKGLVKMKNFANSKNKFGYVYVLTPTGMAEKAAIPHWFLQRKMDEYDALKAEIEALKMEVCDDEAGGLRKVCQ